MDIIIESVSPTGHVFRTKLPKQTTHLKLMMVRGCLESRFHRNIRTMDSDGRTLLAA